jgi:oxygen tolerance protein BatD
MANAKNREHSNASPLSNPSNPNLIMAKQIHAHFSYISTAMKPAITARTVLSFFMLLLFSALAHSAVIDVAVDRNPVSINDSFQLIFTASDTPDDNPDFSPLRQDFDILNQQQSSQSSWTNGSFSKTISWTLNLMAKRSGALQIPAIAFGSDHSQTLSLTVLAAAANTPNNNSDELFLEVEAAPEQAYVQAQVLYTVRFYRRVQIAQASLNEPEPENTVIEKLGEDSNYNTRINGINYAVTERKYALFPQQSGPLSIKPLILTAQVVSSSRSRFNGFFNSQSTQTKRVTSRAVTLDILPKPSENISTHWLPAEQVYIEQTWSNKDLQIKVGEPLTRTLTLLVKGATVSQLPELLTPHNNSQLKSYPDQPVLKEDKKTDGIIAFREEKVAFIPSVAGEYTLPAIEIPWFNTTTQQMETASLPAVTLKAVAAPAKAPTKTAIPDEPKNQSVTSTPPSPASHSFWMWLSLFFASAWLITLVLLIRSYLRNHKQPTEPVDNQPSQKIQDARKALKKACANNDPQAAKQALLIWGKLRYGSNSLGAIAPLCEARLRDEILLLSQHLYGTDSQPWSGKKLAQAFAEDNARKQIKQPLADPLEPLYPL